MIHLGGEPLFSARVDRLRKRAANIAGHDAAVLAKFPQGPHKIDNCKPAVLPIGRRVFRAKTIEIDRDVNVRSLEISNEVREMRPPVLSQDRATSLAIFDRAIVGPGMDFEIAGTFGAPVSKKLIRPPTLKISATPHADTTHLWKFQGTIHPTAAAPFRRTNVPIGMIVERNQDYWLGDTTNPKGGEMMKIPGAIKQERREARSVFAVEIVDQPRGRGKAQLRPPRAGVDHGQAERLTKPRVI